MKLSNAYIRDCLMRGMSDRTLATNLQQMLFATTDEYAYRVLVWMAFSPNE